MKPAKVSEPLVIQSRFLNYIKKFRGLHVSWMFLLSEWLTRSDLEKDRVFQWAEFDCGTSPDWPHVDVEGVDLVNTEPSRPLTWRVVHDAHTQQLVKVKSRPMEGQLTTRQGWQVTSATQGLKFRVSKVNLSYSRSFRISKVNLLITRSFSVKFNLLITRSFIVSKVKLSLETTSDTSVKQNSYHKAWSSRLFTFKKCNHCTKKTLQ